jgi:hypothetical protein
MPVYVDYICKPANGVMPMEFNCFKVRIADAPNATARMGLAVSTGISYVSIYLVSALVYDIDDGMWSSLCIIALISLVIFILT